MSGLDKPLTIQRFISALEDAAGTLQADAATLAESGEDARVWQIAHEELCKAATRIVQRVEGLPAPVRYDPDWSSNPESIGSPIAAPPSP